jgi:hypothetical protein
MRERCLALFKSTRFWDTYIILKAGLRTFSSRVNKLSSFLMEILEVSSAPVFDSMNSMSVAAENR